MKYIVTLSAFLALVTSVHGQARVSIGPRVGLNVCSTRYEDSFRELDTKQWVGGEAGGMATVSRGHLALQASALYSQKGFRIDDDYRDASNVQLLKQTYALNYLAFPVSLAYTQHTNGQGFQVFAGGYMGVLLTGRFRFENHYENPREVGYSKGELEVRGDDVVEFGEGRIASKKLDAGLQAGVGYRYRHVLLQLGYSHGLVDLGADYRQINGELAGPEYHHRVAQLSATYLFGKVD